MSRDTQSRCRTTRRILPAVLANTRGKIIPDNVDQHVPAVGVASMDVHVGDRSAVNGDDEASLIERSD
jgi:hypothetical protein